MVMEAPASEDVVMPPPAAPAGAKPRPHRATKAPPRPAAARPAPSAAASVPAGPTVEKRRVTPGRGRARAVSAVRASWPKMGPPMPARRGMIRLFCVKDYIYGHVANVKRKELEELEITRAEFNRGVVEYEAGQQYALPESQAVRMLRDLGPARYRNPLTEKIERRPDERIHFIVVDRPELDAYLDEVMDAEEERREAFDEVDVNDAGIDGGDEVE